ncbi:hypothetical protein GCM10009801_14260 [Streptomyces albiaxialis]|uniref:Uncharacterized protein n=1 Tax=Streptomyces albiaxialis TaxID=329523 RepID=A0ABN2VNN5_9ACTN
MRATGWRWRWNRGTLCRPWDVRDAWLGLFCGLALVLLVPAAGLAAGVAVYGVESAARQEQLATRHPVPATLLEDTLGPLSRTADDYGNVPARARWRTTDGRTHTGTARVASDRSKGDRVRIWLTPQDRPAPPPKPWSEVWSAALVTGLVGSALAAALVVGVRWRLRSRLDEARLAAWAYEWELIGPRWSSGRL